MELLKPNVGYFIYRLSFYDHGGSRPLEVVIGQYNRLYRFANNVFNDIYY